MGKQIVFRNDSKALSVCNRIRIFEGEKNVDYFEFLVPKIYNDIDLTSCDIWMMYVKSNGVENGLMLNDYLQKDTVNNCMLFKFIIDEKFTSVSGELKFYLKFLKNDSKDIVLESSTAIVNIDSHPSGINTDSDNNKSLIDEILLRSKEAYDKATKVENELEELKEECLTNKLIILKDLSAPRVKENTYLVKYKSNSFMGRFDQSKDYDKGDIVYTVDSVQKPVIEYDVMKSELNLIKKLNIDSSKNAFSSSTLLENGYMPNEGFDLSFNSQWACQVPPASFEFIGIDLESEQLISEFDIAWVYNHYAKKVTLQISEDGKTYADNQVFTSKISYDGQGTRYILDFPVKARYVRFKFENPNIADIGYRLYEIALLSNTSTTYYQFNKDFYGMGKENISNYADVYTLPDNFSFEVGDVYYCLEDYKGNRLNLKF